MFKRKALEILKQWKAHCSETALLVTGARQIGKSYLVDQLGRTEFKSMVTINLYEDRAAKRDLAEATNAQDLITRIGLIADVPLVPGETLIFIDEIQELPDLMTMVKFLVQDGRFFYAFSGSMLGVELKHVRSYPVGFVTEVTMYPMDFEEFCWAVGVNDDALATVRECVTALRPVPDFLHHRLLTYFRTYMAVGGMPAAVQAFLDSRNDLMAVRETQKALVAAYVNDITKYAGTEAPNVRTIFEQLPLQLDEKSVRFRLNSLEPNARYEKFRLDFNWLVSAHVAMKCNIVRDPKSPLQVTEQPSSFKLYESDTGMLTSRYPSSMARDLYLDKRDPNLGSLFENVFAQALTACGRPLFYYMNRKRGEVDFLTEDGLGRVIPIEIKSGRTPRAHAALNALLASDEYAIERGYVFSRLNVEVAGKVVYLPWYAALCLPEALGFETERPTDTFRMELPLL